MHRLHNGQTGQRARGYQAYISPRVCVRQAPRMQSNVLSTRWDEMTVQAGSATLGTLIYCLSIAVTLAIDTIGVRYCDSYQSTGPLPN